MGSIILRGLTDVLKEERDYTYVDLNLDVEESTIDVTTGLNTSRRDIKVSYDEEAIKNSLKNIFNTRPGERFLIPTFGCNLWGYLFQPVTQMVAKQIGNTILDAIEKWEPRVNVENITVVGRPFGTIASKDRGNFDIKTALPNTENEYSVTVLVSIPALRRRTKLEGILTEGGFAEIQSR